MIQTWRTRAELVARIAAAEAEAGTAGPPHRRDLQKHIRRMRQELATYDRFRAEVEERRRRA